MKKELINELINEIVRSSEEKKIDKYLIKDYLVEIIKRVYLKKFGVENLVFDLDLDKKTLTSYVALNVIDDGIEDYDDFLEVPKSDDLIKHLKLNVGDVYEKPFDIQDSFNRHEVTQILQGFKQRITEAVNKEIYKDWKDKTQQIVYGEVEKMDNNNGGVFVNLRKQSEDFVAGEDQGTTTAFLPYKERNQAEDLIPGRTYPFLIQDIVERSKLWPIVLSRKSDKVLEYYLKTMIPEIADGEIVITKCARIAGSRAKVLVKSASAHITEPVAIAVGTKGIRIKQISDQVGHEKIEVIKDEQNVLLNLISLCGQERIKSIALKLNEDKTEIISSIVFVPEEEYVMIIGKGGHNIKLINRLLPFNVEVRNYSESSSAEIGKDYDYYTTEQILANYEELTRNLLETQNVPVQPKIEVDLQTQDESDFNMSTAEYLDDEFTDDINKILEDGDK